MMLGSFFGLAGGSLFMVPDVLLAAGIGVVFMLIVWKLPDEV